MGNNKKELVRIINDSFDYMMYLTDIDSFISYVQENEKTNAFVISIAGNKERLSEK